MLEHRWEERDDATILRLSGDLTGRVSDELRSLLFASLKRASSIGIDLSSVRKIDRGCLRLLCEVNEASIRMNKLVSIERNPSDACRQAVKRAGCPGAKACMLDEENQCIWPGGLSPVHKPAPRRGVREQQKQA
jgi:ABC-type transporter Mla MlaB component